MHTEYEARILDIDKNILEKRLTELGAKKEADFDYRRRVYNFNPSTDHKWIRLRTDGKKTTLTIKKIEDFTFTFDKMAIGGTSFDLEKLTNIENNSNLDVRTVSQLKEDMAADFYAGVCQLSRDTGVQATDVRQDALADANQAVKDNAETQLMEDLEDIREVLGGFVGANTLMDSAYDERDPNYRRLNGRQPR